MPRLRLLLPVVAVVAAAVPAPAAAIPSDARISTDGLGPIKIGMTARQVERANHRPLGVRPKPGACTEARLGKRVTGVFTGRRLRRIDVRTPRYPTRSGVRVGDTEREVYETYPGRLVTEPHKYWMNGHYLKYVDGRRKVVFETDDDARVRIIGTGRRPEIDLVEGCL